MASSRDILNISHCSRDRPLVSDVVKEFIILALLVVTSSCFAGLGIISNILSIIVYCKQGIKDSISVQFVFLSVVDLAFSVLVVTSSICNLMNIVKPDSTALDPLSLFFLISAAKEKVYAMSVVVTILLSAERCLCVVLPFKVKSMFTKSTSIKAIACIVLLFVAFTVPEYFTGGLTWQLNRKFNSSRLLLLLYDNRVNYEIFKDTILAGILPVFAGITTTVCTVCMIAKIQASYKFRLASTTTRHPETLMIVKTTSIIHEPTAIPRNALSGKDSRLAKTVISVDIIFIACNFPKLMIVAATIAKYFITEFSVFVPCRYNNVVSVMLAITYVFEACNCAINIFIYYTSSLKFRTILKRMFCSTVK